MIDYTELDSILIAKVAGGCSTFAQLSGGRLGQLADTLASPDRRRDREGWRLIDRRLQALRKAGRLTFDRKHGWRAAAVRGVAT